MHVLLELEGIWGTFAESNSFSFLWSAFSSFSFLWSALQFFFFFQFFFFMVRLFVAMVGLAACVCGQSGREPPDKPGKPKELADLGPNFQWNCHTAGGGNSNDVNLQSTEFDPCR